MADLRMPDLNTITIAGNLIKDPVLRNTMNGTPVANFTIASNRRFKDSKGMWQEDVNFVGIVAWYKLAESCSEYLRKGSAVVVEGELQSKQWRTEDGGYRNMVEIKARRIQFLDKLGQLTGEITSDDKFAQDEDKNKSLDSDEVKKDEPEDKKEVITEKTDVSEEESSFDFGFRDLKL